MKIINLDPKDLKPYENNTRTHSDQQISQIVASIKEFGFTNPILIDEHKLIIAGHGRVMAAKQMKLKEVPTIELVGLSEAQKKAYIIADNKLSLNAGWDEQLLKLELQTIADMGYELGVIGFSNEELQDMSLMLDDIDHDIFEDEPDADKEDKITLKVFFSNETDKTQLKEELLSRGYFCQ